MWCICRSRWESISIEKLTLWQWSQRCMCCLSSNRQNDPNARAGKKQCFAFRKGLFYQIIIKPWQTKIGVECRWNHHFFAQSSVAIVDTLENQRQSRHDQSSLNWFCGCAWSSLDWYILFGDPMQSIVHAGNVDPSISTEFKHISIFYPFILWHRRKHNL